MVNERNIWLVCVFRFSFIFGFSLVFKLSVWIYLGINNSLPLLWKCSVSTSLCSCTWERSTHEQWVFQLWNTACPTNTARKWMPAVTFLLNSSWQPWKQPFIKHGHTRHLAEQGHENLSIKTLWLPMKES